MSLPLMVVRPEPGCSQTVAAARQLGLEVLAAPLFAIEPVPWQAPDPGAFDAIVAGSANAFRHGGRELALLTCLPVHAVGERTAAAARDAGFAVARVGEGGLQALLDTLDGPAKLLRLAGEVRTALTPPVGRELDERIVYRAVRLPLAEDVANRLAGDGVVVLHSGEAARAFATECARLELDRGRISLAALAPRVAEAAKGRWREVRVAPVSTDAALLALAKDMCQ